MTPATFAPPQRIALLAAAAWVVAVFAPGLAGPFVLDDHVNLVPLFEWLQGGRDAAGALLGNGSGPLGRPLAYATLMANAAFGGTAPPGYKAFNLVLHLASAALVFLLLREVLGRLRVPGAAFAVPLAIATAWAVHPLLVSTALYVVQRMTMLSAIAQLAALLAYVHGRQRLASDPAAARRLLFVAFPLAVAGGLLAKENAVLAPMLALVLELGLFREAIRPREVRWFFGAFVGLPVVAGLAALPFLVDSIAATYAGRDFTLAERLLTQPRVLGDYLLAWLWPADATLGLYRDGYPHSTGLLQPAATLAWLLSWVAAAVAAWVVRARRPLLFVGVFWFLVGHALESSFWPLEPYFEHRNYLPSLGLWLVAASLVLPVASRLTARRAAMLAALVVVLLGTLTVQRAWRWGDIDRLQASEGPPAGEVSRRLQVDRAIRCHERGDVGCERDALAVLAAGPPGHRAAAALWDATFACSRGEALSPSQRRRLLDARPAVVTHNHVSWLGLLVRRVVAGHCPGVSALDLQDVIARWETGARPPAPSQRARLDAYRQALGAEE